MTGTADRAQTAVGHAAAAHLEQALGDVLVPALVPHGFERFGRRNAGRVQEGVLQFVNVQAAAFGPARFGVNYAALPLFRPHDFRLLSLGDRLLDARGQEAWWPADSAATAGLSMQAALVALRQQALPWLEHTRTVAGLLTQLPSVSAGHDPDDLLDRACCLARLGRLHEAAHAAAHARRLYLRDGRAVWQPAAAACAALFAAALTDRVEPLLAEWQEATVRALRLRVLVDGAR